MITKEELQGKYILDACCGGRMFWFNKNHPNVLFMDIRREEKGFIKLRPSYEVNPDVVGDFRDMPFPDAVFKEVVFDPPHLTKGGDSSWMIQKYGLLNKDTWREDLKQGFKECFRVLEDYGRLTFKWSERDIKIKEVLELCSKIPLYGHPTTRCGNTIWCSFMKIPEQDTRK